jgi:hypothetical protein
LCVIVVFACGKYFGQDIPTPNTGDQAMIESIRKAINANKEINPENIIIGAGSHGCEAFKAPAKGAKLNLLIAHQWFDAMKDLANGTVLVIPKHSLDDNFKKIEQKVDIITIQGVLHTRTPENIENVDETVIDKDTDLIVMLAGDTQQKDGGWLLYTPEMVVKFIKSLPIDKKILFLNGPRTGKHQTKDGQLILDEQAHRTETDLKKTDWVTKTVMDFCVGKSWKVVDFKFGTPSLWPNALKFCLKNLKCTLILPGESTSMICEALGVGIHPVICEHDIMTDLSKKYLEMLNKEGLATIYPNLPFKEQKIQNPLKPQEDVIIESLLKIISNR